LINFNTLAEINVTVSVGYKT